MVQLRALGRLCVVVVPLGFAPFGARASPEPAAGSHTAVVPRLDPTRFCSPEWEERAATRLLQKAEVRGLDCGLVSDMYDAGGLTCPVLLDWLLTRRSECPESIGAEVAIRLVRGGDDATVGAVAELAYGPDSELREYVVSGLERRLAVVPPELAASLLATQREEILEPTIGILVGTYEGWSGPMWTGSPAKSGSAVPAAHLAAIAGVFRSEDVAQQRLAARVLALTWSETRQGPVAWAPLITETALANPDRRVLDYLIDALAFGGLPGLEEVAATLVERGDTPAVERLLDGIARAVDVGRSTPYTEWALEVVVSRGTGNLPTAARKLIDRVDRL